MQVLQDLESNLDNLINLVQEITKSSYTSVVKQLPPLERAKFDLKLAYVTNSLFAVYLRLNGKDIADHPLLEELNKIRDMMLKQTEAENKNKEAPKIDKDVAKRLINHNISKNSKSNHTCFDED